MSADASDPTTAAGTHTRAPSDEQLLLACREDPSAFEAFYLRHATHVLAYFARRAREPEVAADLTAETFAAALAGVRRFKPARGLAVQWLYGIAARQLAAARRRGVVEDRARRRLRMPPLQLTDEALERVEALASADAAAPALRAALAALAPDQRMAVEARVLAEQPYAQLALEARTSEAVVRQRVARGLARMRTHLTEEAAP